MMEQRQIFFFSKQNSPKKKNHLHRQILIQRFWVIQSAFEIQTRGVIDEEREDFEKKRKGREMVLAVFQDLI